MCFDEVKIQEGLVWNNKDELIGFDEDHQSSNTLVPAKYVLQFMFKTLDTNDPLSFPLSHFYTAALNSKDITDRFYEGVKLIVKTSKTMQHPIHTIAAVFDGLSANRKFWLDHFEDKNDAIGLHIYRGSKISSIDNECPLLIFIVDPSHVIKRLSNCLHDSFWANEANRKMSCGGKKITWSHIRDTFNYDSNVLKIRYTKLWNEAANGLDHFRKMNTNYATVVFQKKTI